MIAPARLAELRELLAKATPGPWGWESVGTKSNEWCLGLTDPPTTGEIDDGYDEDTNTFAEKPVVVEFVCENQSGNANYADAALIAAARNALPALLDALDAMRLENEALRGLCERAEEYVDNARDRGPAEPDAWLADYAKLVPKEEGGDGSE